MNVLLRLYIELAQLNWYCGKVKIRDSELKRQLLCSWRGHFYRPASKQENFLFKQVQYRCICCGEFTPWIVKEMEEQFIMQHQVTWGPFGSDSRDRGRKPHWLYCLQFWWWM